MHVQAKLLLLESNLARLPGAIVAYSGGADSAFLAEECHRILGSRSLAVTADSPSLPRSELGAASDLARSRRWVHMVVETHEMDDPRYGSNAPDRCYWCKTALFDRLAELSQSDGRPVLLGTNTDDLGDHRPGLAAASERGALAPLVDVGLSKEEVRELSTLRGLPTATKPASACLASRIAYGVPVTASALRRVEASEEWLKSRGYEVVRVRDLGQNTARIEVDPGEIWRLKDDEASVFSALRGLGFEEVAVDPRGYRRGSLNETLVRTIHHRGSA